jgi:hypothetical protein
MTTPSTCRPLPAAAHRTGRRAARLLLSVAFLLIAGCTYTGGQLLYLFGVGKGKLMEAKFVLTEEPILIFVDDPGERISWPGAFEHISNALAQQLLEHKAAKKIIPNATLERLRQAEPEFDKLSCRQIGEKTGATQVLWIEVLDYLVTQDVYDTGHAAFVNVTVRVIDVKWKEHDGTARLWPKSPEGSVVAASLNANQVIELKTHNSISLALAGAFAEKVAKIFYEYRLGDFDKEEEQPG